jgi:hypothetical protein
MFDKNRSKPTIYSERKWENVICHFEEKEMFDKNSN